MKAKESRSALLFDGAADGDATLDLVHGVVVEGLVAAGWTVAEWRLRDMRIAWCSGCFGCWVKTPGVCVHGDAGRDVAAAAARVELLVYLTPVTFGGYSAELKKALDHLIPLLLPDLKKSGPDTRHPQRYQGNRDLLVVGSVPRGEATGAEAHTFRRLVARNRLNLRPERWAVGVVEDGAGEWEVRVAVGSLLNEVGLEVAGAAADVNGKEVLA